MGSRPPANPCWPGLLNRVPWLEQWHNDIDPEFAAYGSSLLRLQTEGRAALIYAG